MAEAEDYIIDFNKEVKSEGGGRFRVKPGQYHVRCLGAKPGKSAQKQTPQFMLSLLIIDGPKKGEKFREVLYATPKAFSRFRTLMEAADIDVPERVNLVKLAKQIKGAEFYVELDDEIDESGKYKPRSRVTFEGFINEADYEASDDEDEDEDDDDVEDDDDEDEPEPPKRKAKAKAEPVAKKKKKKKPVDDDDDELELEDLDD